ncbi:MAG: S9 family peptidase [Gammaproteobacteria bacterium]|nr:S9 family peptidase [Gammaproteobacteria bacterium]
MLIGSVTANSYLFESTRCRWFLRTIFILPLLAAAALAPAQERLTVDHLDVLAEVSDPQMSPDGNGIAYVVSRADLEADEYVDTLWMVSWDGEELLQLTSGPGSASHPRWSPDGRRLAFLADRGEKSDGSQVWSLDRRGGEATQLAKLPGSVSDFAWSPDGGTLALVARLEAATDDAPDDAERPEPIVIDRYQFKNDRQGYVSGPERSRIYLYELAAARYDALTADAEYDESGPSWSPDGTRLAFYSNRDSDPDRTENTDIFVAAAKSAAPLTRISDYRGQDFGPIAWSADGSRVAWAQGPEPANWLYEFSQVAVKPVRGGDLVLPTAALDRDTNRPTFSADDRSLDVIVTDDRSRYLARVSSTGGDIDRITEPGQVVSGYTRAGNRIAVLRSAPGLPAEIYALERDKLRQLTRHNAAWLAPLALGAVTGTEFDSRDGDARISTVITRPPGFDPEQRYPTILWIHGGPYGQDEYGFDFERQVLAANGYVVVQVNYRGSSGRGKAFGEAIFADWGNKDAADVLAGIDHVIELGLADPSRLGVGGWSQGGILTNFVIASDTRFGAAISGAGVANQLALYGADQYVFMYDNEFGPPWRDPERWMRMSYPFFHADRIRTPTLYAGGDKDFNVPIIGSEQMYQALKSLGVPTQLIIYPGQHHSFSRHSFNKDYLERFLAWYDTWLTGENRE